MTAEDIAGILKGEVPAPTKEELRLAAKRQRDRKRYALKTQLNWTQDASTSTTLDSHNVLGVKDVSKTNR